MTTLADRDWRLIRDEPRAGATQMALEEIAARTALEDDRRTVRVYSWEPSTLSLGYAQDPATVDWDLCEREGIDVTRRPTGGGGIYHDRHADVSYSVVAPADELPGDLMDCYEQLCDPLFSALDALGVDADFAASEQSAIHQPACYLRGIDPAHDVVAADGRKLSGNAQYRRRDSVVQHGSLTHERPVERHLATFAADLDPTAFRERVTSVSEQVGVAREETVAALEDAFAAWADADVGTWSDDELARARDLAEAKFANPAWIRDRDDPTA